MRCLLVLVLLSCFMVRASSRPSQAEYSNDGEVEETEYEGVDDEADNDDSLREDQDSPVNEQMSPSNGQERKMSQNQQLRVFDEKLSMRNGAEDDRAAKINTENFSGLKPEKNVGIQDNKAASLNFDNEYLSLLGHRQSNRNVENRGQSKEPYFNNRDVSNMLSQHDDNLVNKRLIPSSTKEGDFLFENIENAKYEPNKEAINNYNNVVADSREQAHYFKQYYNTMKSENTDTIDDKKFINRDRRETHNYNQKDASNLSPETESFEKSATEDEEAAIKRHVKKLTAEEFQELLDSLADDKRELLKKIMDNDSDFSRDSINKREITKKADAVEENNLEAGPLDKLQEGSTPSDVNTGTSHSVSTESDTNKQPEPQTDINDIIAAKTSMASNTSTFSEKRSDLSNDERIITQSANSVDSSASAIDLKTSINLAENEQSTSKTANKREANLDDLIDVESIDDSKLYDGSFNAKEVQDSSNDQGYFCPQDNDLSQLMNDESQLHNGNTYKREVDTDLSDSIKSLEESFPNSNAYDDLDPYAGLDMAPLVRVKRTNENISIRKRAAAFIPDRKGAYIPNQAENEDYDNDEGNEFDDSGFYDRSSSFSRNNVNGKPAEDGSANNLEDSANRLKPTNEKSLSNDIGRSKLFQSQDNMEHDTMSLGSDTDSVLSGVEGVDENLMFSSGCRNRRAVEETRKFESDNSYPQAKLNRSQRSTPLLGSDINTPSENYINVPSYQESDAFGPLPRNYEGELSRYKRVRRVKQTPAQEVASSNID